MQELQSCCIWLYALCCAYVQTQQWSLFKATKRTKQYSNILQKDMEGFFCSVNLFTYYLG